jgi:hypothetical protein
MVKKNKRQLLRVLNFHALMKHNYNFVDTFYSSYTLVGDAKIKYSVPKLASVFRVIMLFSSSCLSFYSDFLHKGIKLVSIDADVFHGISREAYCV